MEWHKVASRGFGKSDWLTTYRVGGQLERSALFFDRVEQLLFLGFEVGDRDRPHLLQNVSLSIYS